MGKDDPKAKKVRPAVKIRLSPRSVLLIAAAAAVALLLGFLAFIYTRFSGMIDARISGAAFESESRVFSAPRRIAVGEAVSLEEIRRYLQNAGYSIGRDPGAAGRINVTATTIEVRPSANSYFAGKNALLIDFARQRISQLRLADTGQKLFSAEIEPELITGLFGTDREKRRPISYKEIPPTLKKAILVAEDRRFFDHPGFDPIRIIGAAWTDLRRGQKAQGASTITMQVARSFFFTTKRQWRRKVKETLMALLLEHRFSKERIFELYVNEVYLGNRGSFAIHGFGEAAQAYFGKDLRDLDLAQYCFLAGIIRAPNRYSSAERRPERAAEARDRVLALMVENGFIARDEERRARETPLGLVSGSVGAGLAGHFVDMVKDDLLDTLSEEELDRRSYRIYTTLDADLQRAAAAAVESGLANVDKQLEKTYAQWRKRGEDVPRPEAALVALNPHTGEIKALVGSRDYGKSQLNHALTRRQPGSVFKPFVFAAALETALAESEPVLTPISTVVDEPTTFYFDGKAYTPDNYGQAYHGTVTLRDALVHSLNVATVKVAEMVGYRRVVALARRLGLDSTIRPTPAVALGAYEMSPLEIAAGYTAFANNGTRCRVLSLKKIVGPGGEPVMDSAPSREPALDPRIAYLITHILEDVVNRGTGAGVRRRGFRAPAAGKTGTSHDGWFVGYTTNLLCAVWVGFDDNRELGLSGAASAGPIWAEFMKRAGTMPAFADTQEFDRPEGVVSVDIDPQSLLLASPGCFETRQEVFVAGTEPTEFCPLHGGTPAEGSHETGSGAAADSKTTNFTN